MIAATGAAPNVRAPAPTRQLTPAERELIGAGEGVRPPATPTAQAVEARIRAERAELPPPSLAIRPGDGPQESSRAAARQGFGEEVARSYARAHEAEARASDRRIDLRA